MLKLQNSLVSDSYIHELCDSDKGWGLFLFLRPKQEQPLTVFRIALIALIPGVALGALGSLLLQIVAQLLGRPPLSWLAFPLTLFVLYFFAVWFLVAPAWNRRVQRTERLRRFYP